MTHAQAGQLPPIASQNASACGTDIVSYPILDRTPKGRSQ